MAKKDPPKHTAKAPRVKTEAARDPRLRGGGKMGILVRSFDWDDSPFIDAASWPENLCSSLSLLLNSPQPMFLWWDRDRLIMFYNDAYAELLGINYQEHLGKQAKVVWDEGRGDIASIIETVFNKRKPFILRDVPLIARRPNGDDEVYLTFSHSPVIGFDGRTAGLICVVAETTKEVFSRQQLKESEVRFQNLADTAPMYIAMADATGNAVYFNKPWLKFTGKKLKDMLGLKWLSTLHPDDAPCFENDFKEAFKKHIPISQEYRFRRADGEYRWMLAVGAPRWTPDGHFIGYFGTYTDFHDLKITQLALKESEKKFRTLIEQSPSAVQMVSKEGKILFSSDSVKNVLGYTPEEIANEGVTPFIHPDDIEEFFKKFNTLAKHPGEHTTLQYRVRHKDGTWAWLETLAVNHLETPNIQALVGNFRNITKQKEAEDKLRESEQRFRSFINNLPNLAWMAKPDGHIYWYNSRWYEYTGTKPADMEGWGWQSVHDPEFLPEVLKKWKNSIKNGNDFEMVFPLKGADGMFRPFLTRVIALRSADGTVIQWVGTNTDISLQIKAKETEAEKERLEADAMQLALQHQELLELNRAKDEFISLASHQLRTPATGVKQFLGMLIEGYGGELSEAQRKLAERSYESNEREIAIINDLLKVAQLDAGRMRIQRQMIDFSGFIEEILDEHRSEFIERKQMYKVLF